MPPQSGFPVSETLPTTVRVHVLGAGPVGLAVAALLQSIDRISVHLYEKRRDYTRPRMVQLAPNLVAESLASYCTDHIDGESVEAIFDPSELADGLAFRQGIPPDLMGLLRGRISGFCPLNDIERSLSDLIDARQAHPVQRTSAAFTAQDAMTVLPALLEVCQVRRQALNLPGFHDKDVAEPKAQLTTLAFVRPDGAFGHDNVILLNHSRNHYIGMPYKGVVLDLLIKSLFAS